MRQAVLPLPQKILEEGTVMFQRWARSSAVLALVLVGLLATPRVVQAQRYGYRWGGGWGSSYWSGFYPGYYGRLGGFGLSPGYAPGYYGRSWPSTNYYSYTPWYGDYAPGYYGRWGGSGLGMGYAPGYYGFSWPSTNYYSSYSYTSWYGDYAPGYGGVWGGSGLELGSWPGYYIRWSDDALARGYGPGPYDFDWSLAIYYNDAPFSGSLPGFAPAYVPSNYLGYSSPGMNSAPDSGKYSYGVNKPPTSDENRVLIEVRLPQSDAEVWFQGSKTKQTGTKRAFRSPPLSPGREYVYEIRVRWSGKGKEATQTRSVPVQAGQRVTVDFTRPE
jgi:uncharacterized protein (TIGR03000 family)